MKIIFKFVPASGAALALLLAAACGAERETAAVPDAGAEPGQADLNIYSARHYDSDRLLYAAFEEETGIRIRVRESGAAELLETMRAEGARSPADVILAADAGTLYRFQEAGLTQPVQSAVLERNIPEQMRQKDGHWFGLTRRARVIVHDPQVISEDEVNTYAELAGEGLRNELCVRSSTNIYNLSLMGEMIGRYGAESAALWAEGVTANLARAPQGGDTAQIEAVAAGQCAVALVNHYYWVRLAVGTQAERAVAARTRLVFPDQDGNGTHVNISGAAVASHAPNPESAVRFIEFLTTPEGQRLLTTETKEYPILAGAPLPEGLEQLPEFRASDFPLDALGRHQAEAQSIYDRAGWH
jgi:iron(III) transport system substrate-binding protein